MKKTNIERAVKALRFKHFSRKGYAIFSVLGREVLIGTLSVATLSHAKAEGVSVQVDSAADTLRRSELRLEEVVVTGSRAPLTGSQQARIVSVITRDDIDRAAAETVNDVLKIATGVDVRQRGGFGVQTDISIGGGTFDQIAVLLNGVNISNPQTGHLSADFPVSLDDIQRIEVIEGAASRIYGASAFNGAVNIVTTDALTSVDAGGSPAKSLTLSLNVGSYGTFGGSMRGALRTAGLAQSLSVGYGQSDGAQPNSYFRKSQGFWQGSAKPVGDDWWRLSWQLGLSTKRYGANTFYSAAYPNQYESNARLFASVKSEMEMGRIHLQVMPYWNRNHDHFQLIRNSATGENFHRTDVYGCSADVYADWLLGRTSAGMEIRREKILSTNLGTPMEQDDCMEVWRHDDVLYDKKCQRTDFTMFLEHNIILNGFTASLGMAANRNTAYSTRFRLYPGIDLCFRPDSHWRLSASWNMAFRMPTFTDLYYKSPTLQGNVGLKPERTQSLRCGVRYKQPVFNISLSAFCDWGTDMIDWVMFSADDVYHSANFSLDNRGFEVNAEFFPENFLETLKDVRLTVGYAYIDQKRRDDTPVYKSNYAMEYLRHKFVATLSHPVVWRSLTASWSFRWQQRMGSYIVYENYKSTGVSHPYSPYGLLSLKLMWRMRHCDLSLSMENLTARRYYDFGNVPQPGFLLMTSAKFRL